jgi:hypothetical protein
VFFILKKNRTIIMGKIHQFQTAVTITRVLGVDITGATETLLKFKKPSLTEGQFTAVVDDATTGKISFTPTSAADLDEYGRWIIWGKVTFSDGSVAESEATTTMIWKAGQL